MRVIITALIATAIAAANIGCSSTAPKMDMNKIAADFYKQKRTYQAIQIAGVSELSIKGEEITLTVEAPMPELRMMPNDPNTLHDIGEIAKNIVLGGLGIYTLGQVATRDPMVVTQPEPVVIRPEVIK